MTEPTHTSRFVRVTDAADIPIGTVGVAGAEGRSFAIGHTAEDAWGAVDNICTHDGGTLGEGELDDQCVECPRHGAKFDLFSGAVKAMPAVFPVNAYPVRIRDGVIEIDLGVPASELEIG